MIGARRICFAGWNVLPDIWHAICVKQLAADSVGSCFITASWQASCWKPSAFCMVVVAASDKLHSASSRVKVMSQSSCRPSVLMQGRTCSMVSASKLQRVGQQHPAACYRPASYCNTCTTAASSSASTGRQAPVRAPCSRRPHRRCSPPSARSAGCCPLPRRR